MFTKMSQNAHIMLIFVYSLYTSMKFQIPTSPEVAEKIKLFFADDVLKPKNMKLVKIETISETAVLVYISGKHLELRDVFFLGYWTNYVSQLNKKT